MTTKKKASYPRILAEPLEIPYTALWLVAMGIVGFWFIMYQMNISGNADWNTLMTFVAVVVILFKGLQPLWQAHTAIIGAILSGPLGRDPRKLIPEALELHLNIVLGGVFITTLIGITLAVVPFGEGEVDSTANLFWNVLLLGGASWIFSSLFKIKSTGGKKLVFGGIIVALLGVILGSAALNAYEGSDLEKTIESVDLTGSTENTQAAESTASCETRLVTVTVAETTAMKVGTCPIIIYTHAVSKTADVPSFNGNTIILPDSSGVSPPWESFFTVVRGQGPLGKASLQLVPKPGVDAERCFFYGPLPTAGQTGVQYYDHLTANVMPALQKEPGC
jgi:hypothetical protein